MKNIFNLSYLKEENQAQDLDKNIFNPSYTKNQRFRKLTFFLKLPLHWQCISRNLEKTIATRLQGKVANVRGILQEISS